MKKAIEDTLSVALTLAAVVIATVVVWRQFGAATPVQVSTEPEFYADWRALLPGGILIGDAAAPIKILEFADLECPFCRQFHQTALHEVKEELGAKVAVVFIHFPLEMHRFAKQAAKATECAEQQERFAEFVDVVFDKQDSIGLKSWTSYAREAHVPDSSEYIQCLNSRGAFARIVSGLAMGERAGIRSTRTVFVNG
ncbi:MAG: DsbA family protein [Gemmatimonadales bacterium]